MSVALAPDDRWAELSGTTVRQELVVAWQHPVLRSYHPVGLLRAERERYSFRYVAAALEIPDFRPLLGFEDPRREYTATHLFPLFAQRAMDARRPDFERYVSDLGLDPSAATPWEQIARSTGRRRGDTLQLFPVPQVHDGTVTCPFLVHGIRHMPVNEPELEGEVRRITEAELDRALGALVPGDPLRLVPEPGNHRNPEAVVVLTGSTPLGYVPDLLVHDLQRLMRTQAVALGAAVLRANGPSAPGHLRLLAELRAAGVGDFRFFQDARWQPLA